MMAQQHVTFGTATYVTVVGGGAALGVPGLAEWNGAQPLPLLLSSFVVALGCLVPDLDHPQSTLSRSLGPVTGMVAHFLSAISGGHRAGMHSLTLPVVLVVLFLTLPSLGGATAAAVLVAISALVVTRFLLPMRMGRSRLVVMGVLAVLVAACFYAPGVMGGHWLAVAAGAGPLLHVAGDLLTKGKVALLWPVAPKKVAVLPDWLRFPTNSFFEKQVLGRLFTLWVVVVVGIWAVVPAMQQVMDSAQIFSLT